MAMAMAAAPTVKVGDKISAELHLDFGFPPERINLASRVADKKVR